MIKVVVGRVGT